MTLRMKVNDTNGWCFVRMSHSQRRDAPGLGSKFVLIRVPHLFLLSASYYDCAHGYGTCIQVLAIEKRGLRRPSGRQFAEASPGECGNFNRFRLKHFSSSSGSCRGSRFYRRRYREYCQVQRYQRQVDNEGFLNGNTRRGWTGARSRGT